MRKIKNITLITPQTKRELRKQKKIEYIRKVKAKPQ